MPKLAFGTKQDFVRDRAAERADPSGREGRRAVRKRDIGIAHAQALPGTGSRGRCGAMRRAPRRRVLDAAQADLGIAALDGLIDGA